MQNAVIEAKKQIRTILFISLLNFIWIIAEIPTECKLLPVDYLNNAQYSFIYLSLPKKELTEIDSRFGDADHGLTMSKIAKALEELDDMSGAKVGDKTMSYFFQGLARA